MTDKSEGTVSTRRRKRISDTEALRWIENKARDMDEESLDTVLGAERALAWKKKRIPGRARRFQNQIGLAFELIKDYRQGTYSKVPWRTIAMAGAALLYFLSPMDLIPDLVPIIGLLDDVVVLTAVYAAVRSDLLDYCLFKGYEPADYFS